MEKTRELDAQKYYWLTLRADIEAYVKGCDICITSKAVRHKPYRDLQSLPVPTYQWKDLSMDFIIGLPISTNCEGEIYDTILVIVDQLTKMIYYEPVKLTINTPGLAKVIMDLVVRHHGLPNSIISN